MTFASVSQLNVYLLLVNAHLVYCLSLSSVLNVKVLVGAVIVKSLRTFV